VVEPKIARVVIGSVVAVARRCVVVVVGRHGFSRNHTFCACVCSCVCVCVRQRKSQCILIALLLDSLHTSTALLVDAFRLGTPETMLLLGVFAVEGEMTVLGIIYYSPKGEGINR
jgi:hypothetical protein